MCSHSLTKLTVSAFAFKIKIYQFDRGKQNKIYKLPFDLMLFKTMQKALLCFLI